MAITRLFQTGWELGNYIYEGFTLIGLTSEVAVSTTKKKTGTYSLRFNSDRNDEGSAYTNITDSSQFRLGFWIYMPSSYLGNEAGFFSLYDGGNPVIRLTYINANTIRVRYTSSNTFAGGFSFPTYIWKHIGIDAKIAASGGWIKVYVDGVEALSITGNTGTGQVDTLYFGTYPQYSFDNFDQGAYGYFDDFYIDDTTGEASAVVVPDLRFEFISPDGDGNYTNWTPSSGSNYECVDEIPANGDTDYVSIDATDTNDSYTLEDFALPTGATIDAVIPIAVAKKEDATDCKIKTGTRLSGTDNIDGTGDDLSTNYGYYFDRQTLDPGGGAWSESDVDSAEVIIRSDGTFS